MSRKDERIIDFVPLCVGGAAVIHLTKGMHALVDLEDWGRVMAAGKWHAHESAAGGHYARQKKGGRCGVFLHSFILGVTSKLDHRDGNRLDNRRSNLRLATSGQNAANWIRQNRTGYRGVRQQRSGGFQALICGRPLGTYPTAEAAALAFDAAAVEKHGEFAILNFPSRGAK